MTLRNIYLAWSDVGNDSSYYLYLMQSDEFVEYANWYEVPPRRN